MSSALPQPAAGPRPWKWTRDDVIRLAELGFFNGQRVMLIDGEVLAMPPMNPDHANGIMFALQHVQAAFGPGFAVRPQLPLALGQTTDPEPDLAVVAGPARSHPDTPTTAVLVIEVADSSLAYDLGDKASLYAAAGIADYWVLDVVNHRLHVFRDPRPDPTQRFGYGYFQQVIRGPADTVSPLAAPAASVRVGELLP
jgi:Uma2 family endonuclease